MADAPTRRHRFFKLNGLTCLDHLPVVCADRFGDRVGMNVKIGFPANFLSLNIMPPFIFPVHQQVAEFQVLNENDRGAVINDVLQPLFALAKRLLRTLATGDIPDETGEEMPAISDVLSK